MTAVTAREAAVLDANILFRYGLRDFLLCVAEEGVFTPVWSEEIHAEWMRNRMTRMGDSRARVEHGRKQMEDHFPGSNVAADTGLLAELRALC